MIDWRTLHNNNLAHRRARGAGLLWAVLAGPLRTKALQFSRRDDIEDANAFPRRQAWCFYASLVIFYLAVGSPLDQIGERFLFSAHMLQHQLLMYPAALLFLLGLTTMDGGRLHPAQRAPTSPAGAHASLGCALIFSWSSASGTCPRTTTWRCGTNRARGRALMFFGAALFLLVAGWPARRVCCRRRVTGGRFLYFVGVLIAMTPVFAYITFSEDILYPTYELRSATVSRHSPPPTNQLLAGVIDENHSE